MEDNRGFDGSWQIKGHKRFILTDTQELLLAVWICAAKISEKAGGHAVASLLKQIKCLRNLCEYIELVWVDGSYRGPDLLSIDNEVHHRGQGYVYLRALGIVLPQFPDRS